MDEIDPQRIYCTNAVIKRVGAAVAVDLSDATLPGSVNNKHMTILFRRHQPWTEDEIAAISKETENWIQAKYGSNRAPVTFNIAKWGNKSVKIGGDLNSLCLDLRKRFGAMTKDKQRVPHCELFKNGKNKNCHVCKQSGHKRKECPRKLAKKQKKKCNKTPNEWPTPENENENGDKLKNRLERITVRTKALRLKKERELKLLNEKENELQRLLSEYDANNVDGKALRFKIKQIAKSFNAQRKEMRKMDKMRRKKEKKCRKKEKKIERRQRKRMKREKKKNKRGNNTAVVGDEQKEVEMETNDDEFVKVGNVEKELSQTYDSIEGSETFCSEGDDDNSNDVEPGNDDEFDSIFEGF